MQFIDDLPNVLVAPAARLQLFLKQVLKLPKARLGLLQEVRAAVQKPWIHFLRLVRYQLTQLVHSNRRLSENLR
jgi:hypothetical protein